MILSDEFIRHIRNCASIIYHNFHLRGGVVLLSGATGMIGSIIVDCLMKMNDEYNTDFRVIAVAKNKEKATKRFELYFQRDDFCFVSCDVNKPIPEVGEIDYVIHAASNTHPIAYSSDPIGTIKTNVTGTENLLEYARLHKCKRFVFLLLLKYMAKIEER